MRPDRYRPLAIALPLLGWLAIAASTWFLAAGWVGKPFPGFTVQANLCTSAIVSREWPGVAQGLHRKHHVLAVDGRPTTTATALYAQVAAAPVGTRFTYTYAHRGGPPAEATVASVPFTRRDFERVFMPFWLGGLFHILVGALVLWLRPASEAARAHWFYCQVMGMFMLTKFDRDSTFWFEQLAYSGFALFLPSILGLGLVFPLEVGTPRTRRRLLAAAWATAGALGVAAALTWSSPVYWTPVSDLLVLLPALLCLGVMGLWTWQAVSRRVPALARSQAQLILLGFAGAFMPSLLYFTFEIGGASSTGLGLLHMTYALFPAAIGYGIVRRQLFDIRFVIRRATLYVALATSLAAIYFGGSALGASLLGMWAPGGDDEPIPGFLAALGVAVAFRPIHDRLRRGLDRLFFGERAGALATLAAFAADDAPRSPARLADDLVEAVARALRPGGLRFRFGPGLERVLGEPPADVGEEGIVVPLRAGELAGELVLAARPDGLAYAQEERALLQVLAAHAATALHRSLLLEERIRLSVEAGISAALADEREEVLRHVVHDMHGHLFNVRAATAVVRHQTEAGPALASIDRSVGRMEALLAEKLRWAREGRVRGLIPLGEALEAADALMRRLVADRGQTLVVRGPGDDVAIPLTLSEVEQIASNLVGNASRHAPPGSTITLVAEVLGDEVRLAVADEGPGFPADVVAGTADHPGLGLRNVTAVVTGVGGRVAWGNGPHGAVAEVWLPRVSSAGSGGPAPSSRS